MTELKRGCLVRTLKDSGAKDWTKDAHRDRCMWGVEGRVMTKEGGHGQVVMVKHHPDGSTAWYQADELEIIRKAPSVKITVTGPGLVVNGPTAVILKALQDAGYDVDWEKCDGWDQWPGDLEEKAQSAAAGEHKPVVGVEADPQPWGG